MKSLRGRQRSHLKLARIGRDEDRGMLEENAFYIRAINIQLP